MKLNAVERALMNNPLRSLIQRLYEARLFERLGGRTDGETVLEIGCGRGVGTEIIFERFGAKKVHAFDLDPEMVKLARRRLSAYREDQLTLSVGDATAIEADEASFDTVFDFGIIHHVPDWQRAVAEVARVLRPGGRFFFEEVTKQALDRAVYRRLFAHPAENRFGRDEFVGELEGRGIAVGNNVVVRLFGDFIVGAGRRESY